MQDSPRVSIIIPVYNGEKEIRGCLDSIFAQESDDYEVIAVDSSPDTASQIIAREFPQVKLLHFKERKSCGEAKNAGVEKASGELVFFLDVDGRVDKHWLSGVLEIFDREKDIDGLCGSVESDAGRSVWGRLDCLLKYYHWLPGRKRMDNARYLVGASSAYRRKVFINNRFEGIYGEDVILSIILAESGARLLFEPSIRVRKASHEADDPRAFIESQLIAGQGSAVTRKKADVSFRLFLKCPALIFLAPFFIVPKMGLTYLLNADLADLAFFLRFFPLFFLGNFFWAAGFFKEALKKGET